MKLRFIDVGRSKKTREADVPLDDVTIEIRKKGGLMSREISVDWDPEKREGTIYVGGWRPVGTFKEIE